jgi:hypothetical protein
LTIRIQGIKPNKDHRSIFLWEQSGLFGGAVLNNGILGNRLILLWRGKTTLNDADDEAKAVYVSLIRMTNYFLL